MRLEIPVKAANHTDPVTHETWVILRKPTNHQTSQVLKRFKTCVKDKLTGKTYRGGNAVQNSLAVRSNMTAAAKGCAGGR